jgi:hypothetical protein
MDISSLTSETLAPLRLRNWLEKLSDPRRDIILWIYDRFADVWNAAPASETHQSWPGGLKDHLVLMMREVAMAYTSHTAFYGKPDYELDSLIIAIFFHDWEKLARHAPEGDCRVKVYQDLANGELSWEAIKFVFLRDVQRSSDFRLTRDELDGIRFAHGERWAIPAEPIIRVMESDLLTPIEATILLHRAYRDKRADVVSGSLYDTMGGFAPTLCSADLRTGREMRNIGRGIG